MKRMRRLFPFMSGEALLAQKWFVRQASIDLFVFVSLPQSFIQTRGLASTFRLYAIAMAAKCFSGRSFALADQFRLPKYAAGEPQQKSRSHGARALVHTGVLAR
jgi:hypothetical protein